MTIFKKASSIVVGVFLVAISINMFFAPHNIAAGGVSGVGILVEEILGWDKAIVVLVLNILMLVLTAIFLDKPTFIKIFFGSILFPIALAIVPDISLVEDQMLATIIGSIIFGLGIAIMYRVGASSGGSTVPPLIFKKYFRLNPSIGLLVTDLTIVLFNIFVFSMTSFFYAVLSLIITSIVMEYVETGLNRKKALMITSNNHFNEIVEMLKGENKLSGKIFKIMQSDTNREDNMLLLVVTNQDYGRMVDKIRSSDKDALIVSYNIADVHEFDFTYQNI